MGDEHYQQKFAIEIVVIFKKKENKISDLTALLRFEIDLHEDGAV
jgi:hypothetical protein